MLGHFAASTEIIRRCGACCYCWSRCGLRIAALPVAAPVNLDSVGQRLGGLDFRWIAFVLFVLCIQVPLGALRWRDIAAICGSKLPLTKALRYGFIGQFFSQVLPSTVGGDAVRIWLMARGGAGWPVAIIRC